MSITKRLLAVLFLIPGFAYSADYYWIANGYQASTPDGACRAYFQYNYGALSVTNEATGYNYTYSGASLVNATMAQCLETVTSPSGYINTGAFTSAYRYGDSCPADSTYNESTGACDAETPPVSCPSHGTSTPFSKSGTIGDGFAFSTGGAGFGTAGYVCSSGCSLNTASSSVKCVLRADGAYTCSGTAEYTGDACTPGELEERPEVDDLTPSEIEPAITVESSDCIYEVVNNEVKTCTVIKQVTEDGIVDCRLDAEQQMSCTVTQPKTETEETVKTITETPTADGGLQSVESETKTVTSCTGPDCSSDTSASTTTTTKDSAGTVVGNNTTCTGSACSSTGQLTNQLPGPGGAGEGEACGSASAPCRIDDSGFAGLDTSGNGFAEKLAQDEALWIDKVTGTSFDDTHGVSLSFIPTFPRTQCEALTFGFDDRQIVIDWCPKLEVIQSALAWLLALFTCWNIFEIFFTRTSGKC